MTALHHADISYQIDNADRLPAEIENGLAELAFYEDYASEA